MQQKGKQDNAPQSPSKLESTKTPISADLFLFQQTVIDMLNFCKKNLRMPPFEEMQVDKLVQNNKSQSIDIYHQYFLMGVGFIKTRDVICGKYDHLIKNKLINKNQLPPQMITTLVNARTVLPGTSGGGSTASSGSNSVVGSALNLSTEKSITLGKLISTIISCTLQPSQEITVGLSFLLEGTRNKANGNQFVQIMQQVYTNLQQYRKTPVNRFISHFLSNIANEVQYHQSAYIAYQKSQKPQKFSDKTYKKPPSIMQQASSSTQPSSAPPIHNYIKQKSLINTKQGMCKHNNEEALYGKCFICQRGAGHFDRELFLPLCGMECKDKLKRINSECLMDDHFSFLRWLLEILETSRAQPGCGDQVIYSLLLREIGNVENLTKQEIGIILQIIVNNFSLQAIGISIGIQAIQTTNTVISMSSNKVIQNSAMIVSLLVRKYPALMLAQTKEQNFMNQSEQKQTKLSPNYFHTKVLLIEMVRMLESLPITYSSLQTNLLKSLIEILTAKETKLGTSLVSIKQLFIQCDCNILETNLVERIFNLISQYALSGVTNSSSSGAYSSQNLGTSTSLGEVASNGNNVIGGNSCSEIAILGMEQVLISLVQVIDLFDKLHENEKDSLQLSQNLVKQKKIKKHIQTVFVTEFNKKPTKAVNNLLKLFNKKISAKDIALILRQNMDYETKVKKIGEKINRQVVGAYFGTANKDKTQQDFHQLVYWEFLKLLQVEYKGKQIDDCLRITFNSFLMPKEGQQVQIVLGPLSLILEPYLGMEQRDQGTPTYQLIMVVLMVQTSNNPNVKENEKLKFDDFKKFCMSIDPNLSEARMTSIYDRTKKRPLQILMEYKGVDVFEKKYIKPENYVTNFWNFCEDESIFMEKVKSQPSLNESVSTLSASQTFYTNKQNEEKISRHSSQPDQKSQEKQKNQQMVESKTSFKLDSSILIDTPVKKQQSVLALLLSNFWNFIYMCLVNKNNLRGLEQACILYGRSELLTEFQQFFDILYKIHKDLGEKSSTTLQNIGNQAKLIILKLGIDYSNYVIGRSSWLTIIKIIYKLDSHDKQGSSGSKKLQSFYAYYEYQASDKLFTRTNTFKSNILKEFLQAMCQFSSSEVKTDKNYTRQMYILHHIAQIIEYNLERFQAEEQKDLWNVVWPTIRNYFRNICLHPRKQISMSAIDSYKQLTMKMVKIRPYQKVSQINHNELMSVYLYIFQRSPSYIKDLIINVLLNVVSSEMKSGWDQVYTILEISDSQDKTVVMKVVNRLINDIKLENVGNLIRLHQIVIKELRIAQFDAYEYIIIRLWHICQFFNKIEIWLETLAKVKDIYKSTTNINILSLLYRICNQILKIVQKCDGQSLTNTIQTIDKVQIKEEVLSDLDSMAQIQDQISQQYMEQALEKQPKIRKSSIHNLKADQIHKLIYFEVFSVQMHILQIKSVDLFANSVNTFKQLDLDVFLRNLGNVEQGKTGFISLFQMFLNSSHHPTHFCYFLHDYFGIVFQRLGKIEESFSKQQIKTNDTKQKGKQPNENMGKTNIQTIPNLPFFSSLDQVQDSKKQILEWLVARYIQNSKDQILQLSEDDADLNKSFRQVLVEQNFNSAKQELIQFYLSSKQYESQSIKNLVFLKLFKIYFEVQRITKDTVFSDKLHFEILKIVVDAFKTAENLNNKPLLRNFLWNNQFFKGLDYLPGLMKQELRAFELMVKFFELGDLEGQIYNIVLDFFENFIEKTSLLNSKSASMKSMKAQNIEPPKSKSPEIKNQQSKNQQTAKIILIFYQDLGLWVTNAEQVLILALKKLNAEIIKPHSKELLNYEDIFETCMELSRVTSSQKVTKQCAKLLEELVNIIY